MKRYKKWSFACLLAGVIVYSACDMVYMKEITANAPQILSFSPETGSTGSEIVISGEHLDDVVSATMGGEKVMILQKVSDRRLSLKVTSNAKKRKNYADQFGRRRGIGSRFYHGIPGSCPYGNRDARRGGNGK
ncbi:MAG: IPT/TIG domain-containing protein [Parabacteroides sp.]|nr:IPT/TIG domain-containing protein [Parabacteroides sp.]